jgi:hypothetical protein
LSHLKVGDKIPLLLEDLPVKTPDPYSILAGWVIGDGHVIRLKDKKRSPESQTASISCYGCDIQLLSFFRMLLRKLYPQSLTKFHDPQYLGQDIFFEGKKIGERIRSINLGRRLLNDGIVPRNKHKLPNSIWRGSGDQLAGFLLGLFSADGSIAINHIRTCCSISLSQSNNALLTQCQLALLRLGITSSVLRGRKARKQLLSDGKGGKKLYNKKQEFTLRITGKENCQKYMRKIGFLQSYKTDSFNNWFIYNNHIDNRSKIRPYSIIKSIEHIGKKPTFCLTEPTHNEITVNGLITGNCGERHHWHPPLSGVINLVGQTNMRQLIRLVYHAEGVLCPVTLLMHLAAAVPVKPGKPKTRACVVVAGGREGSQWEAYPQHQFIHTTGGLPCCPEGGCWRSRCQLVGDGDKKDEEDLCDRPVQVTHNVCIPECMHMISTHDVVRRIETYYECANNNRKYYE